ncbi:MAG TPA: hypothetical protein VIQ30_08305 [Pseudonocardia sp.]
MTESTPIAVMDAQDLAQGGPALQHRLKWLRTEGIDPDAVRRVEVFSDDDGPYAVFESFDRLDGDVIETRGSSGERTMHVIRRAVASLPPAEAAAYDLAARAGKS